VTPPLLSVEGLSAGYSGSQVVGDVSLTVYAGETVVLLGPNGHGKTTLARAISGTVAKTAGRVRLREREIAGLSPAQIVRAGIVHIPQGDLLFPEMTVHDNLMAAAAFDGAAWHQRHVRVREVLEFFPRLEERSRQLATTLSGGERRMLGIGRGLMAPSELLIIDEPSLGLAPIVVDEVYGRIREIQQSGKAILLIEEGANHIELASRLYVLENGRIARETQPGSFLGERELADTYFFGTGAP
jgi:branched-chain amino acid transport system ATP-binding protein